MTRKSAVDKNRDQILVQLHACIDRIATGDCNSAPRPADVAELDRLVVQLQKTGSEHAIGAGFDSIVVLVTLLLVRMQVEVKRSFVAQTGPQFGPPNHDIISPPSDVKKLFSVLQPLIQLHLQVGSSPKHAVNMAV